MTSYKLILIDDDAGYYAVESSEGVIFHVDGNKLIKLEARKNQIKEIIVPHEFPFDYPKRIIDSIRDCKISKPFFLKDFNKSVNRIVLSDGITQVDEKAFYQTHFKEVVWPATCCEIPKDCFADSDLKTISGIDNVSSIGEHAFAYSKLRSIEISKNVSEIKLGAFQNTPLSNIVFKGEIKKIGAYAFNHVFLDDIIIPDSCSEIGNGAFAYCECLESVTWPASCRVVPSECFVGCRKLRQLLPGFKDIFSISFMAFSDTPRLTNIDLSDTIVNYIGPGAFGGKNPNAVLAPYFVSDEQFEDSFTKYDNDVLSMGGLPF